MRPRPHLAAIGAALGLLVIGCGGEPERATPRPDESTAPAPDVLPYLLRADEVPGLTPISTPTTDTGPPFSPLPEGGEEHLRHSGYVSTTYQRAEGGGAAGVSSVLLFEAEAGAREWLAFETSDEALRQQLPHSELTWFRVPAVPGARGWTGPDLHGNAIGQVYWTEGSCLLLISLEVEGPRVGPLSAAATSIYERTGGTCPE